MATRSYMEWLRDPYSGPYSTGQGRNNATFYGGDNQRAQQAYLASQAGMTGGQGLAQNFGQWRSGELGQSYAKGFGGNPSYDQWLQGYQGYIGGYGGPKPNESNYLFTPGSREDIWNRLLYGEEKSQERTGALDKEIRGQYQQMLLDSGKPDQLALSDINRSEKSGKAGAYQSLASRGLGNTTVVDQVQRRVGEDAQRQRTGVYQQAKSQRLGVRGEYARYLNSISNNGPDSSIYANLLTGNASQRKGPDYLSTLGPAAIGAGGAIAAALI